MDVVSAVRSRISSVGDDFVSFLVDKNIPTSMAAVTIAFSTGTFIRSLSGDIVIPLLYAIIPLNNLTSAFKPISQTNIDNFIKEFFSFVLVIILTFLLLNYIFGMITKKKAEKAKTDAAAKEKAEKAEKEEKEKATTPPTSADTQRIRIMLGDTPTVTTENYDNYYPF